MNTQIPGFQKVETPAAAQLLNGKVNGKAAIHPVNGTRPNIQVKVEAPPYEVDGPEDFADMEAPRFVVPGLIPEDGTFLGYAPSGHYKTTFILLPLVLAANGRAMDGSEMGRSYPLIIAAIEDPAGVKLRLLAIAKRYGLSLERVRVLRTFDFRLDNETERLRLAATAKACFPGERASLLIDHYDVSVTANPTDPEVGGQARDGLRHILRSGHFACACLLAHTPWTTTDRAKLPVSLWANMDARASIQKLPDGRGLVTVEHVKNGESGFTYEIEVQKEEIALRGGVPFETVVAEFKRDDDGQLLKWRKDAQRKKRELSADQRTALAAVQRAIDEKPAKPPLRSDVPQHVKGTREASAIELAADLLPRTTRTGNERKPNKQREHASDIIKALHDRKLLRIVEGFLWLSKAAEEEAGR